MATLRTSVPDLFLTRLALLEDVIFDAIEIEDGLVPLLFRVRDMGNKPFVRTTTVGSFGQVPIKQEGANVVYDDLASGFDKTYQADTYELAFRTSKEALDDEQEEVVSDAARALGASLTYTYNADHATLFNNAFTSTTGSPDGATMISTSHTLEGGGTGSNRLSTDQDLSVAALRDLLNVVADTVDSAGKLLHLRTSKLLVPYELSWLGYELTKSTDRPDTADRATNAFKQNGLELVIWPYLTDADAWFLMTDSTQHNVRTYWRERPNLMHDWDFESSSMKEKIRARWINGWSDWRGIAGSVGG